jgi:hypothetical protein
MFTLSSLKSCLTPAHQSQTHHQKNQGQGQAIFQKAISASPKSIRGITIKRGVWGGSIFRPHQGQRRQHAKRFNKKKATAMKPLRIKTSCGGVLLPGAPRPLGKSKTSRG